MIQVKPPEDLFSAPNLLNPPSLFGSSEPSSLPQIPSLFGSKEEKAGSQYAVGQPVSVFSESSNSWVSAKVTFVAPNGCVTVKYDSGAQKTLEPARHHHLRPASSQSGPSS